MVTWKDFIMLPIMQHYESVLCSSSLHLFDQKYRKKNCSNVKYFYNLKLFIYFNILKNIIYFWYKAEFSASLLPSSVHDPSEIILICWFIINIGNGCADYFYLFYLIIIMCIFFLEPVILFGSSLINKKYKKNSIYVF